jgi:hypothetical protein
MKKRDLLQFALHLGALLVLTPGAGKTVRGLP